MSNGDRRLGDVGEIVESLRDLGLEPILVGGMALVLLGSQRVTRDFDFVVRHPGERLEAVVSLFYDRGFEIVSRLDEMGQVIATIDNRRVASIRLRSDAPASAFFFNPTTGLRVDLLFDFPVPAATLAEHAVRLTIESHAFHIASDEDLLMLKKIARRGRSAPGDAEDIAFLEARHRRTTP